MSSRVAFAFFMAAAATAAPAAAPAHDGKISLGLSLGSLGIGPEVTYRPNRWLGIRGAASFLSISGSHKFGDIAYSARLKLQNYGLTGDIYPFGNGLRISAGLREDDNRMLLQASPMAPTRIGDMTYNPAQIGTLSGEVTTQQYAPVATIGYSGNLARHFTLGGDVGVLFHGRPQMGPLISSSTLVTPVDLMNERQHIQSDIGRYRFYPVIQVSAGYRF